MLSCCEKNDTPAVSDYEIINSWIEENMQHYYLWNDRIHSEKISKTENPERYFRQFIVPEDNYSQIEDNFKSLLMTWTDNRKPGYAYILYSTDTNDIIGKITYVVNESPAEEAYLKRGMIFTKINGINLSIDNYQDLILETFDKHTLTVRNKNNSETDYDIPVAEFSENPVFLDTVYYLDNRRIGYLVYNSFTSDNGDLSQEYVMQLNDIFGEFKNQDINELILDLRYNYRGDIFNSMIMASLIVANPDSGEIFAKYQYNKSLQQSIEEEFGVDYLNLYYTNVVNNEMLNNTGDKLGRIFVLTSPKTGVMSEILVNGLKLSTDVIVMGNKTAGHNMFSIFLYEDEPEKQKINTWAIAPVVMQISNKEGNTDLSLNPEIEIMEPLYDDTPLGDINETVLSTVLNTILGNSSLLNDDSALSQKQKYVPMTMDEGKNQNMHNFCRSSSKSTRH
jgi:hypothetical protein